MFRVVYNLGGFFRFGGFRVYVVVATEVLAWGCLMGQQ